MVRKQISSAILALVILLMPWTSRAAGAISIRPSEKPLSGLIWKEAECALDSLTGKLLLKGEFKTAGWTLVIGGDTVPLAAPGPFEARVPIPAPQFEISIRAVGPRGELEKDSLNVSLAPETWEAHLASAPSRPYRVAAGLGPSWIQYEQTKLKPIRRFALTAKASFDTQVVRPEWNIGINTFGTVLPIPVPDSSLRIQFLGANLRGGYALPFVKAPWRVGVFVGIYYTTMLGTQNQLGYTHLLWPQLYPTVSRTFDNGHASYGYLKYTTVGQTFSIVNPQNMEVALGGGYSFPLPRALTFLPGVRALATVDLSRLQLEERQTQLSSTVCSLGVGLEI